MDINQLSSKIIGAAIEVHKALGPGLLESAYEKCLGHELKLRGLAFENQKPVPLVFKGEELDCATGWTLLLITPSFSNLNRAKKLSLFTKPSY
jgi:GxxExxY protein